MGTDKSHVAVLKFQVDQAKDALMRAELDLDFKEKKLERALKGVASENVEESRTLLNG